MEMVVVLKFQCHGSTERIKIHICKGYSSGIDKDVNIEKLVSMPKIKLHIHSYEYQAHCSLHLEQNSKAFAISILTAI